MECEFCNTALENTEPENLALFDHLEENSRCNEQYNYLIDNLQASWTASCSGGA